jgi:hypothetical protein
MSESILVESIDALRKQYPDLKIQYRGLSNDFTLTVENKLKIKVVVYEDVITISADDGFWEGGDAVLKSQIQVYISKLLEEVADWLEYIETEKLKKSA